MRARFVPDVKVRERAIGAASAVMVGFGAGAGILAALVVAMVLLTSACIGAGVLGGVFAPSLFVARRIERESVYSMPLARRGIRHRALAPVDVEQFAVEDGAPCAGRRVADVAWPADCVVARVRRGGESLAPRGDTVIAPGDVVVVVVGESRRDELRGLFRPAA